MTSNESETELYERVYDWLESKYPNDVDLRTLPEPHQTFLCVLWSDGYICNGGFKYLLEASFNGDPEYKLIRKSFERINAFDAVRAFRIAFSAFPNQNPPADVESRLEVWENARDNGIELDGELVDVGYDANEIYWDSSPPIIKLLESYVIDNRDSFPVRIE